MLLKHEIFKAYTQKLYVGGEKTPNFWRMFLLLLLLSLRVTKEKIFRKRITLKQNK